MRRLPFVDRKDVAEATAVCREVVAADGVVLLPTETFYGLGGSPFSEAAVSAVFALKDRPATQPLPVLVADWTQLEHLVVIAEEHRVRLSRSWPGALTVILPVRRDLPAARGGRLAVRIPGHAMLRTVLYRVGPLTGTSANRHGSPPCRTSDEALASLAAPPQLVLDGGETEGGRPSTLVDLCDGDVRILRQGAVAWDDFYAGFKFG